MPDKFRVLTLPEFIDWLASVKATRKILLIQNHHTLDPDYKDFTGSNHIERLKAMASYHVNVRHFQTIAQNLTTFPDGKIGICRDLNTPPAGILGANEHGICIEHLGNFDRGHDQMTPEHRQTILAVNAALCDKFGLTPTAATIVYHSWYNRVTGERDNEDGRHKYDGNIYKSCPGTAFFGGTTRSAAEGGFIPQIAKLL